jgi:glycosyltransferase involved in cell wall biosynthesis
MTASAELPSVTAVMPTAGRPETLDAIRSVVDQDYEGVVQCVVVVDAGDVDRGALVALGREGREVRVISNDHARGPAGARNAGVLAATTDVVAYIDDDDRWRHDKIRKQVDLLERSPGTVLVASGFMSHQGDRQAPHVPPAAMPRRVLLRDRRSDLHLSTYMMRRQALIDIDQLDEKVPGSFGEDYDLLLRVSAAGSVLSVPEVLADINGDGSMFAGRWALQVESLTYLMQKHPELGADRRGSARLHASLSLRCAAIGQRKRGREHAVRALTLWPLQPWAYAGLLAGTGLVDPARILRFRRSLLTRRPGMRRANREVAQP